MKIKMANFQSDSLLFLDFLGETDVRRDRTVLPRSNPIEDYDEKKFRERFRLSKAAVKQLLAEVRTEHA